MVNKRIYCGVIFFARRDDGLIMAAVCGFKHCFYKWLQVHLTGPTAVLHSSPLFCANHLEMHDYTHTGARARIRTQIDTHTHTRAYTFAQQKQLSRRLVALPTVLGYCQPKQVVYSRSQITIQPFMPIKTDSSVSLPPLVVSALLLQRYVAFASLIRLQHTQITI